jgi:nicotinate-nucleotide pyrophosphorylase (carboxylating)
MLDNFTPEEVAAAVAGLDGWNPRPEIEVSGGITIENVKSYARQGIDFISIGAITASAPALDLSLVVSGVKRRDGGA